MASIAYLAVPGFRVISKHVFPVLRRTPVACYSATSKKIQQSGYVVGERTEVDPQRVQEIIDEGKRSYDERNDINSPYYLSWGFDEDNFVDIWTKRFGMFFGVGFIMSVGACVSMLGLSWVFGQPELYAKRYISGI